jgi:hypothetical protein
VAAATPFLSGANAADAWGSIFGSRPAAGMTRPLRATAGALPPDALERASGCGGVTVDVLEQAINVFEVRTAAGTRDEPVEVDLSRSVHLPCGRAGGASAEAAADPNAVGIPPTGGACGPGKARLKQQLRHVEYHCHPERSSPGRARPRALVS